LKTQIKMNDIDDILLYNESCITIHKRLFISILYEYITKVVLVVGMALDQVKTDIYDILREFPTPYYPPIRNSASVPTLDCIHFVYGIVKIIYDCLRARYSFQMMKFEILTSFTRPPGLKYIQRTDLENLAVIRSNSTKRAMLYAFVTSFKTIQDHTSDHKRTMLKLSVHHSGCVKPNSCQCYIEVENIGNHFLHCSSAICGICTLPRMNFMSMDITELVALESGLLKQHQLQVSLDLLTLHENRVMESRLEVFKKWMVHKQKDLLKMYFSGRITPEYSPVPCIS